MNKIYKNNKMKLLALGVAIACVVSLGIFVQSCSQEDAINNTTDNTPLDSTILNSPELEDYIIAGADFDQSIATLKAELNKIDFSKLEVTYDANGNKVIHLPDSVASIKIEEKLQTFNETKSALRNQFPQFASINQEVRVKYFQQSMNSSVNVKSKLIKIGYNSS